jgi:hypothetical protein
VRVSGAEQRARSSTKETWCALGRYTPTEVSTYKSHQSLVKTEPESQPPAFDWTGGVLKRIKLNRDIRMPRTSHGPCAMTSCAVDDVIGLELVTCICYVEEPNNGVPIHRQSLVQDLH